LIDIHCHILPGIDDGAYDLKTALKMARIAVKDGVQTVVATPHCYDGVYNCQRYDIGGLCEEFNVALHEQGVELTVLPGAEVRLTPDLIKLVERGEVVTFGGQDRYLLLELPEIFIPEAVFRVIKHLQLSNTRCIVAHPERNTFVLNQNNIIDGLIFAGAELQVTAGSLTGMFGKEVKLLAQQILKTQQGRCYLASDGHCVAKRKPILQKALKLASRLVGVEAATDMVSIDLSRKDRLSVISCQH